MLAEKTNSEEVITLIKEEKKPTRSLRQSLISNQILRDEDYFSTRRESCISSLGKHILIQTKHKITFDFSTNLEGKKLIAGNWTGPIVISDCSDREDCPVKKWQVLIDFLDLNLLKDPIYVNIALGISLAHFSDATFFIFQPLYLFTLEYSKQDIFYIIAFGAAADFTSRIILAASSIYIEVKARNVYLAGALFTVFARLGE